MKKLSLLAASVAVALTGCGGGDGSGSSSDNSSGNSGVTITAFDGYLKNALIFVDSSNNGVWNTGEPILGLTDEKGQITISARPSGILAVQTLIPEGTTLASLVIEHPEYAGTYTVDMDHPSQPMAHEVVFRTTSTSNIISPITDLIAIESQKNGGDVAAAESAVKQALTGDEDSEINLYQDFVVEKDGAGNIVDGDAALHKTAQILTESKAVNASNYENKALQFAKKADEHVEELITSNDEEKLEDPDYKPVIIDENVDGDFSPRVPVNTKLVIDEDKLDSLQDQIPEIKQGEVFAQVSLDLTDLFSDADQDAFKLKFEHNLPKDSNIDVVLVGNSLTISPSANVDSFGEFEVVIAALDKTPDPDYPAGYVTAIFAIDIEPENQRPYVDSDEYDELQAEVDDWNLQVGVPFEQTLNIENLFKDDDGNIVLFRSGGITVNGLNVEPTEGSNPIITVSGTPRAATASSASEAFSVGGVDDDGVPAYQEILLPNVEEGVPVEPEHHPLEETTWFFIERNEIDGNVFDSVICNAVKFEEGTVYFSQGEECNGDNLTVEDGASYTISDDQIYVVGGDREGTEIFKITDLNMEAFAGQGEAITVTSTQNGLVERYAYFDNAIDVEKRLNIQSNANGDGRVVPYYYPIDSESWSQGTISVALKNEQDSSGELADADISFDHPDLDITCDYISSHFSKFVITGEGIGEVESTECDDKTENGVAYANIDFDISQNLVKDNVYSIIGYVNETDSTAVEAVKLGIVWAGQGNND